MKPTHFVVRAIVLSAVAAGLAAPTALADRQQVARYVSTSNDPVINGLASWTVDRSVEVACLNEPSSDLGGACFSIHSGSESVNVLIRDASTRRVSGVVSFDDGSGTSERFCETATVAVPVGATTLVVTVDSTVVGCGLDNGGPATTGVIAASFT